MSKQEQIGKTNHLLRRGTYEAWVKREANRKRRRAEKRDPENAPTKNQYRGWAL